MENVYKCKFTDRCPGIRAAGVLTKIPGNTVKRCLTIEEKQKIYFIEVENNTKDACHGTENQFVSLRNNNRYDTHSEMCQILKANEMSPYQHLMKELSETAYSSHWRKPLGRREYKAKECVDPETLTHGIDTTPKTQAGDLINPRKSHLQVLQESEIGKSLYKLSHDDYDPGEQILRNYCNSNYNPCMTFGEKTPHFPDGRKVRHVLTWINADPVSSVSVRQADFVDNYKYHLGRSHGFDKYCYPGRSSTEDNRFGICLDSSTHHPLIGGSSQCSPKQEQLLYLKNLNNLRYSLKKRSQVFSFEELLKVFTNLDEKSCGQLPVEIVSNECKKHRICINKPLVKLMAILGIIKKGNCIDYCKFVNLLNWQSDFPSLPKTKGVFDECPNYGTVYSLSMTGESEDTSGIQAAGVPSAQRDAPFPRPRREVEADKGNLEYETDALTVLNPSIFTRYGVNHRDFFQPRAAEEIHRIFAGIGVVLPGATFNELWAEGCNLDKTGGVCVETFRNLLHKLATKNFINS